MHLYIHVPFCVRRCSYCDFAIAVRRSVPSRAFADLVVQEWRAHLASGQWDDRSPFRTVYFGGGTPSRLEPGTVSDILNAVARDRGVEPDAEITLEANPEDVTAAAAAAWRAAGVNRVSLGAQSFEPRALAWMHRVHGADASRRAVEVLRAAGFDNVSLDLIYGLPAALERSWARDLEAAFALEPDHLSLYGLTVERHTPLGRWVERGAAELPRDEHSASEYLLAHEALDARGFVHYEVSNAARPGRESRHNQAGWRRAPYLGLGPSAHSQAGHRRWWNAREWEAWRRLVAAGSSPVTGGETLSPDDERLEALYLGLRTRSGVPASSLPLSTVRTWLAAKWARQVGSTITLTVEGWLRLDALVARVR